MGIYDSFEQYLPEMKEVRERYGLYLKENNLPKTAEEKLFDYLVLIAAAYHFNKEIRVIEFTEPNIADTLQKPASSDFMYKVVNFTAQKMRYREMDDKTEFLSSVMNELYTKKNNVEIDTQEDWIYKKFPALNEYGMGKEMNVVRYALNVKPGMGLFNKLDDLCLKYDAFNYKIINRKQYNQRTDPIIIYANKDNQKEMLAELENIVSPYRRKDEYDMAGYQNLGNGIYIADEIKGEKMKQLKYDVLTKEEAEVFTCPLEDEREQDKRESDFTRCLRENKTNPVKVAFFNWVRYHQYDSAVSSAQYQVAKMIVEAYHKTQGNNLNMIRAKQM